MFSKDCKRFQGCQQARWLSDTKQYCDGRFRKGL
jgi:hypothetical protein